MKEKVRLPRNGFCEEREMQLDDFNGFLKSGNCCECIILEIDWEVAAIVEGWRRR